MTLATLRSRARRKRACVTARHGTYTVTDARTDEVIGTASNLLELEDLIAWIDRP
jgi:hypothetical protein